MIFTFAKMFIIPSAALAVEGSARTLICVVVVPSMGDANVGATVAMDSVGTIINVGCCAGWVGKIAVAKLGVAVNAVSRATQPVHAIINIKRK